MAALNARPRKARALRHLRAQNGCSSKSHSSSSLLHPYRRYSSSTRVQPQPSTPSTTSEAPPVVEIYVCTGRDCLEDGSRETLRRFKALKDEHGLDVKLRARPCMGPCGRGPNIDARRAGVAVKSPGTGVTLWTDVAGDRGCATILAAAGDAIVAGGLSTSAAEDLSGIGIEILPRLLETNQQRGYSHAHSSASTGYIRKCPTWRTSIRSAS